MYTFISWVERVVNYTTRPEQKEYFTLTDEELYSRKGFAFRRDNRGRDLFSPRAVAEFFGIPDGTLRTECEFWKTENLPGPLAAMVNDFDVHWGRARSDGLFSLDELFRIMLSAPYGWKERFLAQFLHQWKQANREEKPGAGSTMLRSVMVAYPAGAGATALVLAGTENCFSCAFAVADSEIPVALREYFWDALSQFSPRIGHYRYIELNAPEEEWQERARAAAAKLVA